MSISGSSSTSPVSISGSSSTSPDSLTSATAILGSSGSGFDADTSAPPSSRASNSDFSLRRDTRSFSSAVSSGFRSSGFSISSIFAGSSGSSSSSIRSDNVKAILAFCRAKRSFRSSCSRSLDFFCSVARSARRRLICSLILRISGSSSGSETDTGGPPGTGGTRRGRSGPSFKSLPASTGFTAPTAGLVTKPNALVEPSFLPKSSVISPEISTEYFLPVSRGSSGTRIIRLINA